MKRTPTLPVG